MKYLFAFIILGFFSNCSKDESWTKDRDQLLGKWTGTAKYTKTYPDSTIVGEKNVSIEFITKEKAIVHASFTDVTVEYVYQPEPERISFNSQKFSFIRIPDLFEVINGTKNTQLWETYYHDIEFVPALSKAIELDVFETWDLKKIE